mgnify:FL=1
MQHSGSNAWSSSPLGAPSDTKYRRQSPRSPSPVSNEDEPISNVTLDTIMGNTHYHPPSPENLDRRLSQQRFHHQNTIDDSQKNVTLDTIMGRTNVDRVKYRRQSPTSPTPVSNADKRYPFKHRILPSVDPQLASRRDKRHQDKLERIKREQDSNITIPITPRNVFRW